MDLFTPLFEAERICLAPMDHEKDPEIVSRWTHDPAYIRMQWPGPARPLSPEQVKKQYEKIEKESDENKNSFYFTIRLREPGEEGRDTPEPCERLIGFAALKWVDWPHGNANLEIAIGEAEERGKGYDREALQLLLHYVFSELNMHRATAFVPEYNQAALELYREAGFVEEVRRREAAMRDGRRWDVLHLGLLVDEWTAEKEATGKGLNTTQESPA